jgi:hypothetical protein
MGCDVYISVSRDQINILARSDGRERGSYQMTGSTIADWSPLV